MQIKNGVDSHLMTDVLIEQLYKMDSLTEVRFKNDFTADVLLINQKRMQLIGVEVKSDKDSSRRLERQLKGYLRWFHGVYVACTLSQLKAVLRVLKSPEFANVGVLLFMNNDINDVRFDIYKRAKPNNVMSLGTDWISKRHQLYQYKWLLDEIWK